MAAAARKDFQDLLMVMLCEDSSSSSCSSDEDDLDLLFVNAMFPSTVKLKFTRLFLDDLSDIQCENMFRFQKNDMERLARVLELPAHYSCAQRTKSTGVEALMILLRRLVYPSRWCDLVPVFGRNEPQLNLIFNEIVDDIYGRFHNLLDSLDLVWLDPEMFSQAIQAKGAPLERCWGFKDGTPRRIARPVRNQRIMFSGHKRIHCLKFQSVQAPNGLIAYMFGPIEGRRHDAFMLGVSGLTDKLRRFQTPTGEPYVVYGDPAYGLAHNILAPFRGAQLTNDEQMFNTLMSSVRISVEWGFGKICTNFAYLDFQKNLKVLLQPVGKYYLVASILVNCHTCLYGSQTSTYFNLDPPSLETYLSNQ